MKFGIFLMTVFLLLPLAHAGKETGNGGDPRAIGFKALATQAVNELALSGIVGATPEKISKLRETLNSAIILSVSKPLLVSLNGIEQDCAVINVPHIKTILISDKWDAIADSRIKRAITLHEIEGLLSEEGTGTYNLSADYLTYTGFRGDSSSALNEANGLGAKVDRQVKPDGRLEDYLCYEAGSSQRGIDISVNHSDLIVYTVGLRAQNGGMYSDGDGRQSIAIYQEEKSAAKDEFSFERGTVVPDSAGRYTDALGFTRIQFKTISGHVKSFVGIKHDGTLMSYVNCNLRYLRE